MSLNWFCNVFLNATTRNANMFIFPKPTRTSSQTKYSLLPPSQLLITIAILIISHVLFTDFDNFSNFADTDAGDSLQLPLRMSCCAHQSDFTGELAGSFQQSQNEKASLCFEEISNMFNLTCSRKTSFNKICTSTVKQRV